MATIRAEVGSLAERSAQGVVEVLVPDLATAVSFYVALGFGEHRRTDGFAVLTWDDLYLFLAEDPAAGDAPCRASLRLIVADVDRIWAHVQRLHLPIGNPIADRAYGLRDFTVRDPCGFEVRFAQALR